MSEELILRHCSPTLAGLKTGNLFSWKCSSINMLRKEIRRWNKVLVPKGIRVLPLRYCGDKALIYVYRPSKLKKDLRDIRTEHLLVKQGYGTIHPERCILKLIEKMQKQSDFPHEIGLFLGYPPEDVQGFMENRACDCKYCGCWKVYGDTDQAKKLFELYKKCTDVYVDQWFKGKSVERLTVSAL